MKKTDCEICDQKELPLNDTIKIDGKVYCANCLETHFPDQTMLAGKKIEKEVDPTICASCAKDFGEQELQKISTYPVCQQCEIDIKERVFPLWVKLFFIAVLLIVAISFAWNWKYYSAYSNIKKSNEYMQSANYGKATALMQLASEKVPEVEDIKSLATYFKGLDLMSRDKSTEALVEFEKLKDKLPPDYNLKPLIIQARVGSSFDRKDYEGFLEASKENLALDSTQAISLTSVASAYACLYAQQGKLEDKLKAVSYLDRAKKIDSNSKEMKDYYNMVEYRLYSRKVIKRSDFIKQFPNGWTK
ncbi:hypothetical protein [Nubsella zeaxanthinifaciens]|uniref:hypothetical protein n=1 Tax=Nubsella zeaxanthinifaciens TaxID=392412 RepID=UPI000DE3650A|nr:hypothetical protein [Nubsella zeaxanthinifaciens]